MKCPVCGEYTISVKYITDTQGEPPMTGFVTYIDDWERECDCTLTPEQVSWLESNLECDEDDYDYE